MRIVLASLCLLGLTLLSAHSVQAAAPLSGLTVSPFIEQITLSKSQPSATYNINLTNHNTSPVLIHLSIVDFTNLNENGEIGLFSHSEGTGNPYSLAHNVTFAYPEVAIGANQSQAVPISIVNANQLADGGHFGAILFREQSASNTSGNYVTINQASSSLLFLSTDGGGTQSLALNTPLVNSFYATMPTSVEAVFGDNGNTQTTPRGLVQILNAQSQVISQGQININSGLILPESKRLFTINLQQLTDNLWPGFYHVRVIYRYSGQPTYTTYSQRFLFINQSFIVGTIGLAVLIIILISYRRDMGPKKRTPYSISNTAPKGTPKKRNIDVDYEESIHKVR